MEKLRKEFLKERKMMAEAMKCVVIERPKKKPSPPTPPIKTTTTKMVIDPEKLEKTIRKACVPVQKKTITVIDAPPPPPPVHSHSSTATASASAAAKVVACKCKAMNLNGTPCKFKAKKGQFCAKHAR